MDRLRWRRSCNLLTDFLLGCLHYRYCLCHLVLLAGELILIGSEVLYAAPDKCEINRHRFKLLL